MTDEGSGEQQSIAEESPASWLEERTGSRSVFQSIFLRKIPKVNWAYTLGSATLIVMTNQIITGILLTIYYVPSVEQAHASVDYITHTLPMGWLIRGMHHWGSSLMVVLVVAHMLRVIAYGSYKYPRELTWFTGIALLLVTFGFGFTGYLLPWDQKAYWASVVGTRIMEVVPLIGDSLLRLIRAGEDVSALTLARFFGAHVWVLPGILLLLVTFHLYLVVRIGITAPPKRKVAE